MDFDDHLRPGDKVITTQGLKILIDLASANYLKDTEIDYIKTLTFSGFKFNNPNAVRTCGCGKSFS